MKVVYVAHRLGGGADREENRHAAADWCGWIAKTFNVAISADWIVLSGVWDESMRDLGIATDLEMVSRADEVWLVGPKLSPGMIAEADHAAGLGKPVLNLVGMDRSAISLRIKINADVAPRSACSASYVPAGGPPLPRSQPCVLPAGHEPPHEWAAARPDGECNCHPEGRTGGTHAGACPEFEPECTCYEMTGGHMPGCYFNRRAGT